MQLKFPIAALIPITVLGFTIDIAYASDAPLLSLSMEHFRDTATVKADPVDATTTISTENGFVEHRGPLKMVWSDEFLKVVIDKNTGHKSFQVYQEITYNGNLRSYQNARYETPSGPTTVPTVAISKQVHNCAVGDCMYTEQVAFNVDEGLLRRLAAAYVPAKPTIWHYKLTPKAGIDFTTGLSNAEIAGFLAKVDEYSNELPAVKASAANASLRADLGIGGMPVAATADQPDRAGVLIIGVNSGSIAQKAGIIVGDILYEFAGRPIKTLTELQSAVAACAPNSAVAIKLYRGTNAMAVTVRF